MPPAVSVLVPVRDARHHVAEALGSILDDSSTPELEMIVVDDGSRDDTAAVVAALAVRDPRLRLVQTPPQGIAAALDRALAEARAPVVARMDGDDRSLPGRIAAQLAFLAAHPEVDVVGTGVALHPDGQADAGMRRYVAWLNTQDDVSLGRDIWIECPLAHPTLAARTGVVRASGGYRAGDFPEDYELLLRLHQAGCRLARLPRVLHWLRDHPHRLTRTDPRYRPAAFRELKARYLRQGPLRDRLRVAVWGAARSGRPFAAALVRAGLEVAAWIDVDRRLIGRPLHGAPVLAASDLARLRHLPILVAVGAAGARSRIRAELDRSGRRELEDYWVVT